MYQIGFILTAQAVNKMAGGLGLAVTPSFRGFFEPRQLNGCPEVSLTCQVAFFCLRTFSGLRVRQNIECAFRGNIGATLVLDHFSMTDLTCWQEV